MAHPTDKRKVVKNTSCEKSGYYSSQFRAGKKTRSLLGVKKSRHTREISLGVERAIRKSNSRQTQLREPIPFSKKQESFDSPQTS
jgi:hypothetical protein